MRRVERVELALITILTATNPDRSGEIEFGIMIPAPQGHGADTVTLADLMVGEKLLLWHILVSHLLLRADTICRVRVPN